ncbi:hypothetical protein PLAN_40179 [Planktothrix rubescens CCAP 1459/22]|jgi:hypothetical protein|uniref:Transposase n=1 Tax=Planktothrix rubescens CCAP 1459/22 TaxID=329571 RepID=A0A6J7ZNU6_PLARU|nr:hypothetical protein PLAN_40179 [Planktothrix rubescens NIVA-CYA 18]CAD0225623.1 conserved hypothetical protein [Planktothrix agardhii]
MNNLYQNHQYLEEAYTSKASFLEVDSLPKYGEKPTGWKASGNRIRLNQFCPQNLSVFRPESVNYINP